MHVNSAIVDRPSQHTANTGRIWGMYQIQGGYRNTRIGGFKHVDSAVKAIARKGGIGFIMNQDRMVIHAVRNGRIVSLL